MRTLINTLHGCLRASNAVAFVLMLTVLGSCSLINEDQSDCGKQAKIDYELTLVTNITTEIETQLGGLEDQCIAEALRRHLGDIFTDYAHDVDLSFYDVQADSARLHHEQHVMDASQQSYTINLPMRDYMHLVTANVQNNVLTTLQQDEYCHKAQLGQVGRTDTITSHQTGLFTARQPMSVKEGEDQSFKVRLYMANCAAALVVDPRGHDLNRLQVYTTGFASAFNVCDSSYVFAAKPPVIKSTPVPNDCGMQGCYCTVSFPSKEQPKTRVVINTVEPFEAQPGEVSLWQYCCYYTNEDGTLTETIFDIYTPLRAGQLKILKVYIDENGIVRTNDPTVGVSVTLDWNEGGHHDVPL